MSKDPTHRFSDRVEDYIRYRPRYPQGLISLLRREIGLDPSWIVADAGSGTGISAEPFLKNGNSVIGIEPNPEMRRAAERLLSGLPLFRSVDGSAEATGLPPRSVDLVIAGQAFHWFDPAASRDEFERILRPPGWIVLFWNSRRTDTSPFLQDYEELLVRHGTDYQQVRHDRTTSDLPATFFKAECHRQTLPNEQLLDFVGLRGRLLSSSYTPAVGDPGRDRMLEDLEKLFEKHARDGTVRMEYETEVWMGRAITTHDTH